METDSEVPRTLRVTEGAGAGLVIMMVTLPPPPPLHLPPPCQQVASCPEQAAQLVTSLAGDEENHQLHATRKQQHLSQQDLSDLQNPPALINAEIETHDQISSTPASTPDTALALRAEGPPDSLLLYRSRRRLQIVSAASNHEEGQEEAVNEDTQASPDSLPEESFVQESVRLFSSTEVAQDMGVGNGVLPSPP